MPHTGSIISYPCRFSFSRFSCTIELWYILWFIAGATSTLQVHAITVVVSISSAIPFAILPITFAVAGASNTRSACFANATCSTENSKLRSNVSIRHLLPVSVSNVVAVIKFVAFCVIRTCTLQCIFFSIRATFGILYAAIPPVTPRSTVFPWSILFSSCSRSFTIRCFLKIFYTVFVYFATKDFMRQITCNFLWIE